jgi:hypothetical protein
MKMCTFFIFSQNYIFGYFDVMLILKFISVFLIKKLHFLDIQVFLMYFGFDKVFGITQKNTSNLGLIAQFFFQNSSIIIQQHIKNLGYRYFLFFFF